ncbi:MAG: hypothetical protein NXI23_17390 [Bacteroidetes bacterium]|jgi:hypothetical protein|nr:hypothetical protein [Bacteroidota bacterium]MDF1868741.1 hypothetical protein [Saprospiraceae bacterium]
MNLQVSVNENSKIEIHCLKNLKFEKSDNEYMVTLVDNTGFEILKGYGKTTTEAINDLHHNLI